MEEVAFELGLEWQIAFPSECELLAVGWERSRISGT